MKLEKLFDMQRELDERIIREKGLIGQDLLPNRILALQVELGELANEWRGFKFWSRNQDPRREIKCHACKGAGYFMHGIDGDGTPYQEGCGYCDGTGIQERPLLEEYVDCLHFILSIGLEIYADAEFDTVTFDEIWDEETKYLDERMRLVDAFTELIVDAKWKTESHGYWREYLEHFTDLGKRLGLSKVEVLKMYTDKNATNHERQGSGY